MDPDGEGGEPPALTFCDNAPPQWTSVIDHPFSSGTLAPFVTDGCAGLGCPAVRDGLLHLDGDWNRITLDVDNANWYEAGIGWAAEIDVVDVAELNNFALRFTDQNNAFVGAYSFFSMVPSYEFLSDSTYRIEVDHYVASFYKDGNLLHQQVSNFPSTAQHAQIVMQRNPIAGIAAGATLSNMMLETRNCEDYPERCFAPSCLAVHELYPDLPAGTYLIDPDGDGGDEPFETACDQESVHLDIYVDDVMVASTTGALWQDVSLTNFNPQFNLVASSFNTSANNTQIDDAAVSDLDQNTIWSDDFSSASNWSLASGACCGNTGISGGVGYTSSDYGQFKWQGVGAPIRNTNIEWSVNVSSGTGRLDLLFDDGPNPAGSAIHSYLSLQLANSFCGSSAYCPAIQFLDDNGTLFGPMQVLDFNGLNTGWHTISIDIY
jgi:hypothetical protein